MKIVYIPQQLYPALKKADLRSQDLCNVDKLMGTLSADDVAFYFWANDKANCPIPKPLQEFLPNLIFGGVMPFTDTAASKSLLGKFNHLKIHGAAAALYENDAILTSDCMEEDLLIITHTAASDAVAGEKSAKESTVFYDRIIQQLLVFLPASVVLGSPVLLGWMKSVQTDAKLPNA
ncbi:hypothetical protein LUCX_284 [Xanthomonas phage vB_XciM_LucasX]|nr:hypothetical protein LUCX_284 [Xanthomonas phage vB_XciM_LucasX]